MTHYSRHTTCHLLLLTSYFPLTTSGWGTRWLIGRPSGCEVSGPPWQRPTPPPPPNWVLALVSALPGCGMGWCPRSSRCDSQACCCRCSAAAVTVVSVVSVASRSGITLLTTYHLSLITYHLSLLRGSTTYHSILTTHYSYFCTHYSLLTTHYSLLTTHHSPLTTH